MSIYGYCRISTPQQNIERQERNIKAAYPDAVLVSESYTGTKIERPKWSRLLTRVTKGDTIVFDSVSRMSRDAEKGCSIYEDLYNRGVLLAFLKEPHINTLLFQAGLITMQDVAREFRLAEKEVIRIHEYTSEGHQDRQAERQADRPAKGREADYQKEHRSQADYQAAR